ncbi:2-dehydro-3-deoxygalactonokinase [Rhodoferax sp. U11-2br]|uniref:2-dehydro-3-deoxygalactonokinase n=1 Tax=Rhodoferax sp. U11-2br TaxID=2838878 RepID=UPI001BEC1F50|nr:2-dehydro-3-deoxygalactonokinase [Rhodoferax sp. U11-2br]MBT3069119.1 2-dehydro-3-deoxygalactonokinase [Rhodoferax sp. U11-2br]
MPDNHTPQHPELIALDWGTSSLRAFLLADAGQILQTRSTAQGLQALPLPGAAGFEKAFADIAGDWLTSWPQLPVVAGGMVGSAQGWKEAPYVRCPVDVGALAKHSVSVPSGLGMDVVIAPGLLLDEADNAPDVIRGEEIQIAGALATNPALAEAATLVMPGTHSKWVQITAGQITHFSSYMTGEIFSVLVKHSILGRLMTEPVSEEPSSAQAAFAQGVEAARHSQPGDFTHQIFAARTLGLTQRLPQPVLKHYLSGLLIGHELVSGLAKSAAKLQTQGPLLLIGEPSLCQRYAQAFAILGVPVTGILDNPAPRGLWEFAKALGLIHQPLDVLH